MSNGRLRRWIKFAALGLPLSLAGCGGGAMTTAAVAPTVDAPAFGEARAQGIDLLGIGDRLRASGDARNAVAMYHQAHLADPQSAIPLLRLGDTLMELGANADAAEAYGKALAVEPNNGDALLGLGIARVRLAQPRFAIAQFESALAADSRNLRAYNGLGVALDMAGDHGAAQEVYRTALEIDPDNAKILNNLGLSLTLSGRTDEAVALLERVNAAPAATAVTRQNLALAYGLSGQPQAAERVARIDLRGPAVERNLAFYAAHRTAAPGDGSLAQTLGVRRNGEHYPADPYPANPPSGIDVAPATPAPATEPTPARSEVEPRANELAATGAPVPLLPYALEHPGGGEPGDAQIAQRVDPPANPAPAREDVAATQMAASAEAPASSPQTVVATAETGLAVASPAYRVQLAAYRSPEEASAGWRRLTAAAPDLLGRVAPVVYRVDLGPDKGVFFRLRAGGFADRQTARAFCRDLKARQIDCMAVRAEPAADVSAAAPSGNSF